MESFDLKICKIKKDKTLHINELPFEPHFIFKTEEWFLLY